MNLKFRLRPRVFALATDQGQDHGTGILAQGQSPSEPVPLKRDRRPGMSVYESKSFSEEPLVSQRRFRRAQQEVRGQQGQWENEGPVGHDRLFWVS